MFEIVHLKSLCGYLLLWKVEISDSTVILSTPGFPLKVGRVSTMLNLVFTSIVFYLMLKLCGIHLMPPAEVYVSPYSFSNVHSC